MWGGVAIIARFIKNVKCFLISVNKMQLKLLDFLVFQIDLSSDEREKFIFCGGPPQGTPKS